MNENTQRPPPDPRYGIVDALVAEFGWGAVISACNAASAPILPGTLTVIEVDDWWQAKWEYGNSECSFLSPDKTKAVAFVMDYAQREMIRLNRNPPGEAA